MVSLLQERGISKGDPARPTRDTEVLGEVLYRCPEARRATPLLLPFSTREPVAWQRFEEEKESHLPFFTVFTLHFNGEEFCLSNLTQWAWLCIASPLALCFRFCAAALQQRIEPRTKRGVEPTRSRKRFDFCVKELCLHGALLACQVQPSSFISILSCYNRFISELNGLLIFLFPQDFWGVFPVAIAMRTQTATDRQNEQTGTSSTELGDMLNV